MHHCTCNTKHDNTVDVLRQRTSKQTSPFSGEPCDPIAFGRQKGPSLFTSIATNVGLSDLLLTSDASRTWGAATCVWWDCSGSNRGEAIYYLLLYECNFRTGAETLCRQLETNAITMKEPLKRCLPITSIWHIQCGSNCWKCAKNDHDDDDDNDGGGGRYGTGWLLWALQRPLWTPTNENLFVFSMNACKSWFVSTTCGTT